MFISSITPVTYIPDSYDKGMPIMCLLFPAHLGLRGNEDMGRLTKQTKQRDKFTNLIEQKQNSKRNSKFKSVQVQNNLCPARSRSRSTQHTSTHC